MTTVLFDPAADLTEPVRKEGEPIMIANSENTPGPARAESKLFARTMEILQ